MQAGCLQAGQNGVSEEWLSVEHAPAQYVVARKLQLREFEAAVGLFLGSHTHEIDLDEVDSGTAAVLRGACKLADQQPASEGAA